MSSLEMSDEIFNKVAEAGREKRGGEDPRYDVMKICHEYIKNDPQLYEEFKKLKLLGGNKDAEDFFTGLLDNKKDEVEHVTGKEKSGEEKLLEKFDELAKKRIERIENDGTRKIIVQGMKDLFQKMRQDGSKKEIMDYLLSETYNQKRRVEYPDNPDYEKAWELAVGDNSLKHKIENNWVYRGNFTSAEKKTVNRGSLNITITEDFVRDLDSLIKDGVIDANYKFGEPGIQTEAGGRHDAVNIYFLTEPSSEAIKALSGIADKYYRGDNLLGKQISKGFSMSEFGSVSDTHAKELVRMIEEIDPEAGKSVRGFLTNKERIAMSEAQFYSTKETLNLLGIDMEYSSEKGFQVKKI